MSEIDVIKAAHEVLGSGEFKGCKSSYTAAKSGCNECCTFGSILLPGEQDYLLEKKSREEWAGLGVSITQGKVTGCLGRGARPGEKICKLGDDKTVYCKIYPEAVWIDGPESDTADVMHLSVDHDVCPATKLSPDKPWLGRVKKAKKIIRAGIGAVAEDIVIASCPAKKFELTMRALERSLLEDS